MRPTQHQRNVWRQPDAERRDDLGRRRARIPPSAGTGSRTCPGGPGYRRAAPIGLRAARPGRGTRADSLLTSAAVNQALLRGAPSPLQVSRPAFRPPLPPSLRYALLRQFTRQKNTVLFNGQKIRLCSDPLLDETGALQPIGIRPTGYFDTLVTNDAVRLSVTARDGRTVFSGAGYCFPGGVMPDCRDSRCANQFGTTVLALTSDDYFVIAGQGTGNAIHPGKWTATGSGSADWADTRGVTDLQDLIRAAAVRELAEETGLPRPASTDPGHRLRPLPGARRTAALLLPGPPPAQPGRPADHPVRALAGRLPRPAALRPAPAVPGRGRRGPRRAAEEQRPGEQLPVVVHGTAVPPAGRGPQRAARDPGRAYGLKPKP